MKSNQSNFKIHIVLNTENMHTTTPFPPPTPPPPCPRPHQFKQNYPLTFPHPYSQFKGFCSAPLLTLIEAERIRNLRTGIIVPPPFHLGNVLCTCIWTLVMERSILLACEGHNGLNNYLEVWGQPVNVRAPITSHPHKAGGPLADSEPPTLWGCMHL